VKLRIKGATLRLRLTQGEIRALGEAGHVEEHVPFPGGRALTYRLRRDAAAQDIEAAFSKDVLDIRVPEGAAREWCSTDLVTLAREQPLEDGTLRITLEKDYACLAPRSDEDESDNFPHPGSETGKTC
jgi:hypothetical protein